MEAKIQSSSSGGRCGDLHDPDLEKQCRLPPASLAERKAAEPGEVGAHAAGVAKHEGEAHFAENGAEVTVKKLAPRVAAALHRLAPLHLAHTAIAGTLAIKEFVAILPEHARLRADAIGRENHNLGMGFVVELEKPGTFPPGWIAHQRERLMGPGGKLGDSRHSPHVVNKVIDAVDRGVEAKDAGVVAYRDYWAANGAAGVREAYTRDLRDQKSLDAALTDERFSTAYQRDPAFREGVRAAMWQAREHPAAFDQSRARATALRDDLERAGTARRA